MEVEKSVKDTDTEKSIEKEQGKEQGKGDEIDQEKSEIDLDKEPDNVDKESEKDLDKDPEKDLDKESSKTDVEDKEKLDSAPPVWNDAVVDATRNDDFSDNEAKEENRIRSEEWSPSSKKKDAENGDIERKGESDGERYPKEVEESPDHKDLKDEERHSDDETGNKGKEEDKTEKEDEVVREKIEETDERWKQPTFNIVATGLHADVTPEDLKTAFSEFGAIHSITFHRKGYAYIYFLSEEAQKAVLAKTKPIIIKDKRVKIYDGESKNVLFVGNIPKTLSEEKVKELFEKLGTLPIAKLSLKAGFCFVTYANYLQAEKALPHLNHKMVEDQELNVEPSKSKKPIPLPGDPPKKSKTKERRLPRPGPRDDPRTLYLKNIGPNVTEDQIKKICSEHGKVVDLRLVKHIDTGKNKGFAFIEFGSSAEAKKAMKALYGTEMDGRLIGVEYSRASPPRGGGKRGGLRGLPAAPISAFSYSYGGRAAMPRLLRFPAGTRYGKARDRVSLPLFETVSNMAFDEALGQYVMLTPEQQWLLQQQYGATLTSPRYGRLRSRSPPSRSSNVRDRGGRSKKKEREKSREREDRGGRRREKGREDEERLVERKERPSIRRVEARPRGRSAERVERRRTSPPRERERKKKRGRSAEKGLPGVRQHSVDKDRTKLVRREREPPRPRPSRGRGSSGRGGGSARERPRESERPRERSHRERRRS